MKAGIAFGISVFLFLVGRLFHQLYVIPQSFLLRDD